MRNKAKKEFFEMETEFKSHYFQLKNGETIGYRTCGNKSPNSTKILLIHGSQGACSITWEKLMKLFTEKDLEEYDIYAPCLRGFGYTTYKTEITSTMDLVNDLREFIKECLKTEKLFIVGHSVGGFIS